MAADRIDPALREEIDRRVAAGDVTRVEASPPPVPRADRVSERRAYVRRRLADGVSVKAIAHECGVTPATIYGDQKAMGVAKRARRQRGSGDAAVAKKVERAAAKRAKVKDRRRFKVVPVPMGQPNKIASAAVQAAGRSIFRDRVFTPSDAEPVLKDGSSNSKIGGDVLVGWLKGARILTLTLEERATCPRTCAMWAGCYGNAMQHARRWAVGPELLDRISADVRRECAEHDRVLVRLHVLGDFYAHEYVDFWANLLTEFKGLHVFGFSAWGPKTEIGERLALARAVFGRRFMMRHSGCSGTWGSFTLPFPTDRPTIGDAIVCPEQIHAIDRPERGTHCGNCAVCWTTSRPVAFIEH